MKKLDSLRAKWEKLQGEFRKVHAEIEDLDRHLALKYGPGHLAWIGRGERAKLDKLKKKQDRFQGKIFDMAEAISPRNWASGVPSFWISSSLTFDDMIRPLAEPLSVVPPLAYGATSPIT